MRAEAGEPAAGPGGGWAGRAVCVTGGTGFLGGHLVAGCQLGKP